MFCCFILKYLELSQKRTYNLQSWLIGHKVWRDGRMLSIAWHRLLYCFCYCSLCMSKKSNGSGWGGKKISQSIHTPLLVIWNRLFRNMKYTQSDWEWTSIFIVSEITFLYPQWLKKTQCNRNRLSLHLNEVEL